MLQLILAEDHHIVRDGMRMLLETNKEIKIVGEAVNGRQVLEFIAAGNQVDVVLADINMPELDGISLIREVRAYSPATQIVILSMYSDEEYITQAFREGAAGYLLKTVDTDELSFALKYIQTGGKYLCAELTMMMLDNLIKYGRHAMLKTATDIEFSARELEVLHLIAEGLTNSQISDKLFISKRTVEGHRQSLLDKTGSRNTATLIRFAMANGIIQ